MKSRIEKLKEKEKKEKVKTRKKRIKKLSIYLIILILLIILYSFFIEPNILIVKETKLQTNKITTEMHGIKIVQFSDLHYGTYYNSKNLKKLTKKINNLNPDIIIFNGDLIDPRYTLTNKDIKELTKQLKNLNAKLGKYAVYGNHDYNQENLNNIMYDSSFKVLKNEYDLIYDHSSTPILIYGIDDVLYGKPDITKLNEIKDDIYKIIVVHEPDYIDNIDYDVDLVLSGHSHNKQINIPLISNLFLPEGAKKYYKEHYKVNNKNLYITNGVGCGLIKIRLFSPPSINLFRLTKDK